MQLGVPQVVLQCPGEKRLPRLLLAPLSQWQAARSASCSLRLARLRKSPSLASTSLVLCSRSLVLYWCLAGLLGLYLPESWASKLDAVFQVGPHKCSGSPVTSQNRIGKLIQAERDQCTLSDQFCVPGDFWMPGADLGKVDRNGAGLLLGLCCVLG